MSIIKSFSATVILFFAILQMNFAQATLSGIITLEDGSPASGTFVQVVEQDSFTMVKFATTDAEGKYIIKNIPSGSLLLSVKSLGYVTAYSPLELKDGDALTKNVQIQPNTFLLEGATVEGQALGLRRTGDTLFYNLKVYGDGTERNLSDMIENMPGLDISDEGKVQYLGKDIDKVLIEGKDVVKNQHEIATEGIDINKIEDVRIIEKYKDKMDLAENKQSDKVAMDINIKKEFEGELEGEVRALGGTSSSWLADGTMFKVTENQSFTIYARGNAAGETVLNNREMWSLNVAPNWLSNQGGWGRSGPHWIFFTGSDNFAIGDGVNANTDAAIAANLEQNFGEKFSLKGSLVGSYLERSQTLAFDRTYTSDGRQLLADENGNARMPGFQLKLNTEWQIAPNTYFETYIPVLYSYTKANNDITGALDTTDYNTGQIEDATSIDFKPAFAIRQRISDEWSLGWTNEFALVTRNGDNQIISEDTLFNLGLSNLVQHSSWKEQKLFTNMVTKYTKDDLESSIGVAYSSSRQVIDLDLFISSRPPGPFKGNVVKNAQDISATWKVGIEKEKWDWRFANTLSQKFWRIDQGEDQQQLIYLPAIEIIRKFSDRGNSLSFSYNREASLPEVRSVARLATVIDGRNIDQGNYPIDKLEDSHTFRLFYHRFQMAKQFSMFGNISYSINKNQISSFSDVNDTYNTVITSQLLLPDSRSLRGTFFIRVPIYKNEWSVRFNTNGSRTDGEVYINALSRIASVRSSIGAGISIRGRKLWDYFSTTLGFNYNHSNQKVGENDPIAFDRYTPSIQFGLGDYKGWQASQSFKYAISQNERITNEVLEWDATLSYQPKDWPVIFEVVGNNLLNLTSTDMINTTFTNNYIEESTYPTFPGYLMGGIRWKF